MPDQWNYRDVQPGRPQHPPTQAVHPQPRRWRPPQYSQTRHLAQMNSSLPPEPPRPQPGFTPQPRPQRYDQPRYAAPQQYGDAAYQQDWQGAASPPKKRRRVFLWVFLGIQALFLIWIITGIAGTSHSGSDAHTQAVQFCADKANWQYLFKSQTDCVTHYGNGLNDASNVGKGLGVAVIVVVWIVVDFFLGLGYGIYRLASRR